MRIFLARPSYGLICPGSEQSVVHASVKHQVLLKPLTHSILADCFNALWSAAIDNRKTLQLDCIAMLHSDVGAYPGWLDTLVEDLYANNADMMSATIAIKDNSGRVSTTVAVSENEWIPPHALSFDELKQLPPVFSSSDVGGMLLVNSGCWVARLDRDWCEDTDNIFFEIRSRIEKRNGKRIAVSIPEDFGFSRKLHAAGCKVMATQRVRIDHYGMHRWSNQLS